MDLIVGDRVMFLPAMVRLEMGKPGVVVALHPTRFGGGVDVLIDGNQSPTWAYPHELRKV